ncbi:MAG TPA: PKD domain-containing protein [Thermoanaerobaculia bacterium]|nr:PKD domain-containing protein [Thermoanaerobaculia bacterium]
MKKRICGWAVLCLVFSLHETFAATQRLYVWSCVDNICSFSANPLPGVVSYTWRFGDGTFGAGQNVTHSYNTVPGSGTMTGLVTLFYNFSLRSTTVRCYIQWYEPEGVGGIPGPEFFGGTCEGL